MMMGFNKGRRHQRLGKAAILALYAVYALTFVSFAPEES
jgi:hypothetical protein